MSPIVRADLSAPTSVDQLAEGERLIVRAFRCWILGLRENTAEHWSVAWNDFAGRLGAHDGKAALSGLAGLVRELHHHARRRFRHHHPCCGCLTGDEVALVGFVGACQRGEWVLARALAEWLVHGEGIGGMIEAGARLSEAMLRASLFLPSRNAPARERLAAPTPGADTTVH
ncbi:MAG: hypothetical protein ACE5GS_05145 [Kiloniellaceae bacterium]